MRCTGIYSEFGLVVAKGVDRIGELLELADSDETCRKRAERWRSCSPPISKDSIDRSTPQKEKDQPPPIGKTQRVSLLDQVTGFRPLIASVIAASVPEPRAYKSRHDFAAWLGLTPKQNWSSSKAKLGAMAKQGNRYIGKMLVLSCTSALRVAGKRKGALADWIAALRTRKPERLVAVALADKLARIV